MITFYDHQKEIINANPLWTGIFQGTGSGKTITALTLAKGKTLIIVQKQQALDRTFEKNLSLMRKPLNIKVISKETFRRDWKTLPKYDTVIVDEAHNFFGVLPDTHQKSGKIVPKTSQLFDALHNYTKNGYTKPERFYLLSATPASKPMNVWAIATILGKDWNYFHFREIFYTQRKVGYRSIWLPINSKELKQRLAMNVKKLGYTGTLFDYFDVPQQVYKTVYVSPTTEQRTALKQLNSEEADPMAKRAKQRTIENGVLYDMTLDQENGRDTMKRETKTFKTEKIEYILERAEEFPKMLIFANYIGQIEEIAHSLKKEGFTVLTLTGSTTDRGSVVSQAEASEQCIVIAQCGISSGYELKTFPVVIFASKSYRYLDYEQGIGRVLRADSLKTNLYIHLVCKGGTDEACHKAILSGVDFQERIMS